MKDYDVYIFDMEVVKLNCCFNLLHLKVRPVRHSLWRRLEVCPMSAASLCLSGPSGLAIFACHGHLFLNSFV